MRQAGRRNYPITTLATERNSGSYSCHLSICNYTLYISDLLQSGAYFIVIIYAFILHRIDTTQGLTKS